MVHQPFLRFWLRVCNLTHDPHGLPQPRAASGVMTTPADPPALAAGDLLVADGLRKVFGGLMAVNRYDLRMKRGEIVGLIGPNGAGKTTVINMLSGLEKPTSGTVTFRGVSIGRWSTQRIARLGLARTFQNLRLFAEYTAIENVVVGLLHERRYDVLHAVLGTGRYRAAEERLRAEAAQLLARVGLADDASARADSLPYGKQRRLEIARALALDPQLLLLDEPAAGMVDEEQRDLAALMRSLRDEGLTVLIVDHNVRFLLSVVDRVQVMNYGEIIAQGDPQEVVADQKVVEAYLGSEVEISDDSGSGAVGRPASGAVDEEALGQPATDRGSEEA